MDGFMVLTYGLLSVFSLLIIAAIFLILYNKHRHRWRQEKKLLLSKYLVKTVTLGHYRRIRTFVQKYPKLALDLLLELAQTLSFRRPSYAKLIALIRSTGIENEYFRKLKSSSRLKRMDAAIHLSILPGINTQLALEQALKNEKDYLVKLSLCNALADTNSHSSIPCILNTLSGSPHWYYTKVNMLLTSFAHHFLPYAIELFQRNEIEIKNLLIDYSSQYPAKEMKQYLLNESFSSDKNIAYRSIRALGIFYYRELNSVHFLHHSDFVIRNIVIEALVKIPTRETILKLIPFLSDEKCVEYTAATLSNIIQQNPKHLEFFIEKFANESSPLLRNGLAKVLANRIDYLLVRLITHNNSRLQQLIAEIIHLGKINSIIGLLNKNRNPDLENAVITILAPLIQEMPEVKQEIRQYLRPVILSKLQLEPLIAPPQPKNKSVEKDKQFHLRILLFLASCTIPLVYAIRHWADITVWTPLTHLTQFVLDFNYYIAFYSAAINFWYCLLLFFSLLEVIRQATAWKIKKQTFLFKPRILPSISIIAPAYQEEATIIESVNSLLNLHYPNYELIVVNDGSNDNTLNKLIEYYDLDKIDAVIPEKLKTKPIRGIYCNKHIPKLIVVDKANGGKADALNVGINVSKKEYFCGIDADSLLEKDALIKIASMILDSPDEAIALGGNIFPINGCIIDKGQISAISIPKNFWARIQTVEYLRAFMAGRLGWAYLKSMLIISGAFGLFRKDRVIEIGGYLTSNERYKKDTVGEDMELVVRLRRHMHEKHLPYSIHYAHNANCWTEVPESLTILQRQRDRWQRGLIDIMYFHKSMMLNPRYRRTGMLALPYYFIFELFGPLIEIQGYAMVFAAGLLGLLNFKLSLLLFSSMIVMGIAVSLFSLGIAETDCQYFSSKDMTTLILFAFIENFGIRQFISFWRVTGYFSALKQSNEWGKMTRQGFQSSPQTTPAKAVSSG